MAKRPPKKTSHGTPRWRTRRVGSGITEKTERSFPLPSPEWLKAGTSLESRVEEWKKLLAAGLSKHPPPDDSIAWARGILEKAKLPTDPGRMHPRSGGGSCTLLDLVVMRGYRELDAPEWFAAKILTAWHKAEKAREALRKTDLPEKARRWYESQLHMYRWELGETVALAKMKFRWEEKVLKHRRLGEGGRKSGPLPKRSLGIEKAIRDSLAKSPGLSAPALWNQLMRHTKDDSYCIGEEYEIYGEDQELIEVRRKGLKEKSLKFRSFKDYVSRLKKEDK